MLDISRVEWTQGLFLRPEHFQQQERFLEAQRARQARLLHPHGWGIAAIAFDGEASQGLRLTRIAGILPGGTVFDSELEPCLPPTLPLVPPVEGRTVYLTLARVSDHVPSVGRGGGDEAERRYLAREVVVPDLSSTHGVAAARPPEDRLTLAVPNLRLSIDEDGLEDHEHMAIARVRSLDAGGIAVLDGTFSPTCLSIGAGAPLMAGLARVRAALHDAAKALRAVMHPAGADADVPIAAPLAHPALPLAVLLARHGEALRALASGEDHPRRLHGCCAALAAELGVLDASTTAIPDYDHVRPAAWMELLADMTVVALEGVRGRVGELDAVPPTIKRVPARDAPEADEPKRPARRGIEVPLR